jgi:hypothetical protein
LPFKIVGMGSIPATDNDFLAWREEHRLGIGSRDAMVEYVRHLNRKSKSLFDEQMEEYKTYMRSAMSPEQRKELEGLRTKIAEHKAEIKTLSQSLFSHLTAPPRTFSPNRSSPTPRTSFLLQNSPFPRTIPFPLF